MVEEDFLGAKLLREMSREDMIREVTDRMAIKLGDRLKLASDKEIMIELINLRISAYGERTVREAGLQMGPLGIIMEEE
jgi:hypothetical protein